MAYLPLRSKHILQDTCLRVFSSRHGFPGFGLRLGVGVLATSGRPISQKKQEPLGTMGSLQVLASERQIVSMGSVVRITSPNS